MKVLISGASGFVGKYVLDLLIKNGHEVHALSRNPEKNSKIYPTVNWIEWSGYSDTPDISSLRGLDAVINLVGENIAGKRWNNGQKKEIYNSRIDGTKSLFQMLKSADIKPKKFISTSAVGIYGDRGDEPLDEDATAADDFLGNLCGAWEKVVEENSERYEKAVILRVGLVLGKGGGLAEKLAPIFKLGLGGKLGNGKFYMSWIHVKDLARIYLKAMEDDSMEGVFNAVAPFSVRNRELTRVLGETVRKPTPFSVPKFGLKLAMGEMGEYVTKSANVVPKKLKEADFHYLYPTIEVAVKDVVSKA